MAEKPGPKLFSTYSWEATLLENILPELQGIISHYCRPEFPVLKPAYRYQSSIGARKASKRDRDPPPGEFKYPNGIVFAEDGTCFVCDRDFPGIQCFQPDGSFLKQFNKKGNPLSDPNDLYSAGAIVLDPQGNLIVGNLGPYNGILVYDRHDGSLIHRVGGKKGFDHGEFDGVYGLVVDSQGNTIVADTFNSRLQVFSPDGKFLKCIGSAGDGPTQFSRPCGLAMDPNTGNIVVVENGNNRVQILDPEGEKTLLMFGDQGCANGQFSFPMGVAVDGRGSIIVADQLNHRLQIFSNKGNFLMCVGGEPDHLDCPSAVAIDQEGKLWVADSTKFRIVIFG